MSRHFCCCIPVRVAVFLSSLFSFLFSSLVAAVAVFILIKTKDEDDPRIGNLTNEQKGVCIGLAVVYGLVAVISLFGFIGSVIRSRGLVAIYSTMTILAFLLQTASDAYFIYSLFHGDIKLRCTTDEKTDPGECKDVLRNARGITIALLAVMWLIQLYIVVVIRRYVKQLREEQNDNRASHSVNSAFNMGPTGKQVQYHQVGQDHGLLAPSGHYTYSDPHHSFGTHA